MRIADALLDDSGRVDPARWASALRDSAPVGECSVCASPALPAVEAPDFYGRRYYGMRCPGCGEESVVPVGRVVRAPRQLFGVDARLMLAAGRERDAAILGER